MSTSEAKLKFGLNEIREYFLKPRLANTPFRYRVFISDGEYVKAVQDKSNIRTGTINAIMNAESTDIMVLGGGLKAVSMICSVTFLLPVDDNSTPGSDSEPDNTYYLLEEFKNAISEIFPVSETITMELDGKRYVGAFAGGYPVPGMLMQRQYIGTSMEYTCTFEVAYLDNAINSASVQFMLSDTEDDDGDTLPVAAFSFNRRSTIMANLYSNNEKGEAETYAESSAFGVDVSMPAISPEASDAGVLLFDYVTGQTSANKPLWLTIKINNATAIKKHVIIGEASYDGGGIDNISMRVSFVPFVEAEEIEG